ncbi:predicted protein, partial [Arabidopsis lyrata subsp. lyrata]
KFSRNCSSFSKSRSSGSYRLVERPERKCCFRGVIPAGTGFNKGLVHCSRQHTNILLEKKTNNLAIY